MFETLKTVANLRREVYWHIMELCWNGGACKSAYKSAYSLLEFGRTYNY